MPLETVQPGKASDGNGLVLFVTTLANPAAPKVTELTAGTVKKLTYGLTPDGFNATVTENVVTSGRYTLKQELELPGTIKDELEIKYVYTNTSADVVRLALPEGTEGFLVRRLGVANDVAIAASQIVTVWPVRAGVQREDPPAANTELTMSQKMFVTGTVHRQVTVTT